MWLNTKGDLPLGNLLIAFTVLFWAPKQLQPKPFRTSMGAWYNCGQKAKSCAASQPSLHGQVNQSIFGENHFGKVWGHGISPMGDSKECGRVSKTLSNKIILITYIHHIICTVVGIGRSSGRRKWDFRDRKKQQQEKVRFQGNKDANHLRSKGKNLRGPAIVNAENAMSDKNLQQRPILPSRRGKSDFSQSLTAKSTRPKNLRPKPFRPCLRAW